MPNGMETDYKQESIHCVAIKWPSTGRPTFLQSSYPPNTWRNIVSHAKRNAAKLNPFFVMDDTPEGQAILNGTPGSDITLPFLLGLPEESLNAMALRYDVEVSDRSNKKSIALRILAAINEDDDGSEG